MIFGECRVNNVNRVIINGLIVFYILVLFIIVQWVDEYYYLLKEFFYIFGKWEMLLFQVVIMNVMGYELICVVNFIKFVCVGYIKMLLGVEGYFIEYKLCNSLLFQLIDLFVEDFMKFYVELIIRDVFVLLELVFWFGCKYCDNMFILKCFFFGVGFWCFGGVVVKNYCEKLVDVVCYDELLFFELDVEKEGLLMLLGDKCIEGFVWFKFIWGFILKVKGLCQIEKVVNELVYFMCFYVLCLYCGEEQYFKFGDGSMLFGLKWEESKLEMVYYFCEYNGCVIC